MSQAGELDFLGNNPGVATSYVTNSGTAVPILNVLEILGAVEAAGTNPLRTVGSGNTVTVETQFSQAIASTNAANVGLAAFDSTFFAVDANGFVTFIGGSSSAESFTVDAHTAPGTNPVVASGSNNITITGAQVAAGTTVNVIRTDSLAANTFTIQIQRSQAVASSTIGDNGVSHFDSSVFTVDSNGFVSLKAGAVTLSTLTPQSGTTPVVPTAGGTISISGALVAAGTSPIATVGGTNILTINVQKSQAIAAADSTKVGLSNFNSAQFTVDGNGFVSLIGGSSSALQKVGVDASTAPGTNPVLPNGSAQITVTGGQVAPGVVGANVVRTNSLAANIYTIEIQQTSAVASVDTTKNGVAHFNSAQFTNNQGFISLSSAISTVVIQVFSSSGTYTPTAGMKYCIVEVLGGGGGGGGAPVTGATTVTAAAGGGAGGYGRSAISAATIGASQTVTIGAGGAGGVAGANGSNGGDSSLGSLVVGDGGTGGGFAAALATTTALGGLGGNGGGQITTSGSFGGNSFGLYSAAGSIVYSGAGGNSIYGQGGGGLAHVAPASVAGNSGASFGSGGGGACQTESNVGTKNGGAGMPGYVIVTEFIL